MTQEAQQLFDIRNEYCDVLVQLRDAQKVRDLSPQGSAIFNQMVTKADTLMEREAKLRKGYTQSLIDELTEKATVLIKEGDLDGGNELLKVTDNLKREYL